VAAAAEGMGKKENQRLIDSLPLFTLVPAMTTVHKKLGVR
jgi:hypothetical protein